MIQIKIARKRSRTLTLTPQPNHGGPMSAGEKMSGHETISVRRPHSDNQFAGNCLDPYVIAGHAITDKLCIWQPAELRSAII